MKTNFYLPAVRKSRAAIWLPLKKSVLLALALCFSGLNLWAQPWMEGLRYKENPTFFEIQQAFNDFWAGKTVEKGKGFKAFKRWEWYWEQRVDAQGNFPPAGLAFTEMARYKAEHEGDTKSLSSNTGNWTSMGPTTSTGGYVGIGRINCIVFHPTQANTIFVGTAGGGLWKSTNNGASWSNMTDFLQVLGVSGLAINPNNPNEMYLATGDGNGADSYSVGVLKSTDGGVTWNTTGLNWTITNYRLIRKLIMHPNNSSLLIAATSNGVWRTTDAGQTWSSVLSGNYFDIEFKPGSTSTFYVAGSASVSGTSYGRVYRSTNNGQNWTQETDISGVNRTAIAVSPANPDFVALLCSSSADSGFGGFYSSTDGGDNFTLRSSSPNLMGWSTTGSDTGGQGWYDLCVAVDPTNANIIYTGGVNTWKSTNGGTTWAINTMWYGVSGIAEVHADKHDLVFQNATTLYQANDGGIYRTSNGGTTWTDISNGLAISQMYRLGGAQTTTAVITGLQDNSSKLRSSSGVWTQALATGDGMESAIDPANASIMYTESYFGVISRSTNGGQNWTNIHNNIADDPSGAWVTPYVLDPQTPATIYAGYQELYKSTNRGNSWTNITNGATGGRTIYIVTVAPSNPQIIYLYATNSNTRRIYKTVNGGASWTTATYPPGPATNITSIAIHPTDPNVVWITYSGYNAGHKIYRSTDAAATWTNFSGTLPNLPANTVVYQVGSNDGLYLGMDSGVFYRDGSMTDWMLFNTGLPNVEVTELEIQYAAGKIRAATYGRGLWESDLATVSCATPALAQLSATQVTGLSARLNCSLSGVLSYDWRYRIQGAANWTDLTAGAPNFIDISGLTSATTYEFQVQTTCADGQSGWSASQTFTTGACPTLTTAQISATNISANSVQLNCSLTGGSNYNWRYRVQGLASWTTAPATTTAQTTLSGLLSATTYEYQVAVQCGANAGAWSGSQFFSTTAANCAAPNAGQTYVDQLTYNSARLNCTASGVTSYDWRYRLLGGSAWTDLAATAVNFANISNLQSSSQYEMQVSVQCSSGQWSDWSFSLRFTTPAPPCATPAANAMFSNNVTTSSAQLNSLVTGMLSYDWRYRLQGAATWTDVTASNISYTTLSGLNHTTTYEYQSAVQCPSGIWSEWSGSNTFTTSAPACNPPTAAQLSATNITANSATLNCALPGASLYGWRYRVAGAPNWTTPANTAAGLINLSGLSAATQYEYQSAVQCQSIWTDWSATQTFTTAGGCAAPALSDLSATNITTTTARLNCALGGANAYDWRYRQTGAGSWIDLNSTAAGFTDLASLMASNGYEFQVSVQCGATWSQWSATRTFATAAPLCPTPQLSEIAASNLTYNSARLNCGVTGVNAYDWRYRIAGAPAWTDVAAGAQNFLDLSALLSSTEYEFQSAVQCGGAWSQWSATKTFVTLDAPCEAPNLGAIYANNLTPASARLNCSLTAGINEYDWRYRDFGAGAWIDLPATTTPYYDLLGLSPSSQYEFQVAVRCGATWSPWSFQLRFITPGTTLANPDDDAAGLEPEEAAEPASLEDVLTEVSLQPVPARHEISVSYRALTALEGVQLDVFDLNGKRVLSRRIGQEPAGEHRHSLELTDLGPGLYTLQVRAVNGIVYRRFLKAGR